MADTTSLYIDSETALVVEEIKALTRLSKAEISRQAFSMLLQTIKNSQPTTVPAATLVAHAAASRSVGAVE